MIGRIVAWFKRYQQRRKDRELIAAMHQALAENPRIAAMYRQD
jgi:hypothetical protein